ncbi:tribbles homolog 1 [Paramormyrops kingsleyae]|uniref:Tribbles pseudokinase 1 n=1 Tax=Paramormyrops kingsleyae TaxID=1676925 RepID=A0A3B3T2H6_9TELE|nr:tribbles homolog 1 [Paramormyrops kingsleyae]
MNVQWTSSTQIIRNGRHKRIDADEPVPKCPRLSESSGDVGYLASSPGSPVWAAPFSGTPTHQGPSRICQFLLIPIADRDGVHSAFNIHTGEEYVCKVFSMAQYQEKIRAYSVLPAHRNISRMQDIILGERCAYVFLERDYGDLHMFVKGCRRLGEQQASRLFYQAACAVAHCHQAGIVLGDLKLRKFVFTDEKRTHLKLESLEDCRMLDGDDDSMSDKHGCPAYVSPEILNSSGSYSGKQADVWSLGVMLYTLLVGRYPFHDADPSTLFSKIRRGQYCLPDSLSPKAKCLVHSLLRKDPWERLTAAEILLHPWFQSTQETGNTEQEVGPADQTVPTFHLEEDDSLFC